MVPSELSWVQLDSNNQFIEDYGDTPAEELFKSFNKNETSILTPKNTYEYMMIVPEEKITWDGKNCDWIGVGYEAF